MFKNIKEAWKIKEVRKKLLITLALLLVYRIGCWLPIPGINISAFGTAASSNDFLGIISAVSGNALSNGAILALGVIPYINASIIIQLLGGAIPALERLAQQGDEGRKKINIYTRIVALVLATAQAIGIATQLRGAYDGSIFGGAGFTAAMVVIIMVAGAMFTVWLGERITEIGVGNGLSLLIFVGILATAGQAIADSIKGLFTNIDGIWNILLFLAAVVIIFGLIAWVDLAERKVTVQYAKQIKGRKMYGGQATSFPIKLNAQGVMPIILAMTILSFPQLIMSIFWPQTPYPAFLATGGWLYTILTAILILLFSYFMATLTFKPDEIARQMQQNGGFINGIRPGKPTSDYLKNISNRLTFFGAIFLALVALIPTIVFSYIGGGSALVSAFSSTGLLIVVSCALEFDKQLESQLLMRSYKGFLK